MLDPSGGCANVSAGAVVSIVKWSVAVALFPAASLCVATAVDCPSGSAFATPADQAPPETVAVAVATTGPELVAPECTVSATSCKSSLDPESVGVESFVSDPGW